MKMLNVLTVESKPLSELVAPLDRYWATGEINFEVEDEDKDTVIKRLAAAFCAGRVDRLDGITVEYDDWWFNVRKSNTEPLLRLNLEAVSKSLREERKECLIGLLTG